MIVLENEGFRVEINPFGAELTSFRSKTTGTEYVWGGDPAAWKRHAPVLFPIVGRLKDKTYTVDGASFEITQHGFGRDLEWEPKQVSGTCAEFALTQSECRCRARACPASGRRTAPRPSHTPHAHGCGARRRSR